MSRERAIALRHRPPEATRNYLPCPVPVRPIYSLTSTAAIIVQPSSSVKHLCSQESPFERIVINCNSKFTLSRCMLMRNRAEPTPPQASMWSSAAGPEARAGAVCARGNWASAPARFDHGKRRDGDRQEGLESGEGGSTAIGRSRTVADRSRQEILRGYAGGATMCYNAVTIDWCRGRESNPHEE
jgi:hypothetical protein